jgi:16S rRNA (uracil1498-N3)-methyltransferase
MHRFFVPKDEIPIITGSDAHQIKDVLRMKVGDDIELLDGCGSIYHSKIFEIKKDKVVCDVISTRKEDTQLKVKVTIAQCLPKAKKMDLIIQKCTELGAVKIIPTLSERSISKVDKLERWKKIAKEAAEQCGRSDIPEILPLTQFKDVLKLKKDYDLALIPWELEKQNSLKNIITSFPHSHPSFLSLIGPEGGFSKKEVDLAIKSGFNPVSLGKRILRTETAGMAMLAMLNYAYS